ncbi:MAG: S8 family serine peptidase, partial [Chthoniobacterales bacterium]
SLTPPPTIEEVMRFEGREMLRIAEMTLPLSAKQQKVESKDESATASIYQNSATQYEYAATYYEQATQLKAEGKKQDAEYLENIARSANTSADNYFLAAHALEEATIETVKNEPAVAAVYQNAAAQYAYAADYYKQATELKAQENKQEAERLENFACSAKTSAGNYFLAAHALEEANQPESKNEPTPANTYKNLAAHYQAIADYRKQPHEVPGLDSQDFIYDDYRDAFLILSDEKIEGPELGQKKEIKFFEKLAHRNAYIRTEKVIDSSDNVISYREMVANQLIITLPEGMDKKRFLEILGNTGGYELKLLSESHSFYLLTFNLLDWDETLKKVSEISGTNPEPNYIASLAEAPDDTYYQSGKQWNLNGPHGIKAPKAWDIIHDAPSVFIGVADSGIYDKHEDLKGNIGLAYDATCNEPDKAHRDVMNHGTPIAGIIGAHGNNKEGIAGIAWKTNLLSFKCIANSYIPNVSDVITSLEEVIKYNNDSTKIDILNCSFSIGGRSDDVELLLKSLSDQGTIIVMAAGNWEKNIEKSKTEEITVFAPSVDLDKSFIEAYPASYVSSSRRGDRYTNGLGNIIVVASSCKKYNKLAEHSNYGEKTVDIAAPGERIFSTKTGSKKYKDHLGNEKYSNCYGEACRGIEHTGTSFAAPHVTGALALMLEYSRRANLPPKLQLTSQELIKCLFEGADRIKKLKQSVINGRRLNLYGALLKVKELVLLKKNLLNGLPQEVPQPEASETVLLEQENQQKETMTDSSISRRRDLSKRPDFIPLNEIPNNFWLGERQPLNLVRNEQGEIGHRFEKIPVAVVENTALPSRDYSESINLYREALGSKGDSLNPFLSQIKTEGITPCLIGKLSQKIDFTTQKLDFTPAKSAL